MYSIKSNQRKKKFLQYLMIEENILTERKSNYVVSITLSIWISTLLQVLSGRLIRVRVRMKE